MDNNNASPMPAMVRKAHYKSRNGCISCKKRHVKCSETKPKCSHCTRLGIECNWPEGSSSSGPSGFEKQSPAAATPSYSAPSPSPRAGTNGNSQQDLSIDDLKLLHFWVINSSTAMTYQSSPYMWQSVVVELGFRHHFLLHGILSVAASHKATIYPSEREDLLVQSAAHVERGLPAFRACLESPLPSTAVPVFLMAALLSVQSLGSVQAQPPIDPIGDLCLWMRMVRGSRSTIQNNWTLLLNSEIGSLLQGHERTKDETTESAELTNLKSLIDQAATPETREIYLACVDQLRIVFVTIRELDGNEARASSMVSSWVATVPDGYCDLLVRREPVALVIIVHFATLFRCCPNVWWFRFWDHWILNAVQSELAAEYQPWLEWPTMKTRSTNGSMASTPTAMGT